MSMVIPGEDCPISEQLLFQIYDASKHRQPIPYVGCVCRDKVNARFILLSPKSP